MNEGVEPIQVEKMVNTASPSLVYLIALLSYQLAIIRFKVKDDTEFGIIGSEYFKAIKRRFSESTGEYVEGNVLDITHFVFTEFSQSEIEYDYVFKVGDEKNMLRLIGINAVGLFDTNTYPEIENIMKNEECKMELENVLAGSYISWTH